MQLVSHWPCSGDDRCLAFEPNAYSTSTAVRNDSGTLILMTGR
jgi:hypothetical protein